MHYKNNRKMMRAAHSAYLMAEHLESRRLLSDTMTVTGVAFVDGNLSGQQDPGETGVAGVTVFQDLNYTGVYAVGDPVATTGSTGQYTINNIQPTAKFAPEIVVEPLAEYNEEETGTAFSFTAGSTLTYNIPCATQSYVTVEVQQNVETNGFEAFPSATVYADLNDDGVLDAGDISAVTGYTGGVRFGGFPQGQVPINLVIPSGYSMYAGSSSSQTVTVGTLTSSTVYFKIVSNTSTVGSISGNVFADYNGDGVQQTGEPGFANATVYLDLGNQGSFNPSDPTAVTDSTGAYSFTDLQPGSYIVREVLPSGYYNSTQQSAVNVTAGANTTLSLGAAEYSNITGSVYNDSLGSGFSTGNAPLSGVTVYLDENGNGVLDAGEPSAVSNSSGNYTLYNLPAGNFQLREVLPAGDIITQPQYAGEPGFYNVSLGALIPTAKPFGDFKLGTASGTVFDDLNGDGIQEAGERGLEGWTVFADINGTGVYASNDPSSVTSATGNYQITGLPPGTLNFYATSPGGPALNSSARSAQVLSGSSLTLDYPVAGAAQPNIISGTVYTDNNDDGVIDTGDTVLAGAVVFIDSNNDGQLDNGELSTTTNASGQYTLQTNSPGDFLIRVVLPANTKQTLPAEDSPIDIGFPGIGGSIVGQNFAVAPLTLIPIVSGTVYTDLYDTGVYNASTDTGLAGRTVYADLNGNGVLDPGEPSTTTNAFGDYSLATNSSIIRTIIPAGWTQTVQSASLNTYSFGEFQDMTLTGVVYNDVNGNGQRDATEPGLAGVTVFEDLNQSLSLQAGDPSTVTSSSGIFTLTGITPQGPGGLAPLIETGSVPGYRTVTGGLSIAPDSGRVVTQIFSYVNQSVVRGSVNLNVNPNGGSINLAGVTVFADLNNDGVPDAGDIVTTTDGAGAFQFGELPAGSVTVRVVIPTGYMLYSGSAAQTVAVGTQTVSTATFTLESSSTSTGSIAGVSFQDTNSNGTQDPGELPAVGRTIYLDSNNNGVLDPGELSVLTDSAGRFLFPFLAAGNYTVRQVLPAGALQTAPASGLAIMTTVSSINGYASNDNQLSFGSQITPHPTAVFSGSTVTAGSPATVSFSSVSDVSPVDAAGTFSFSYDFNNDGVYDLTTSSPTATLPASDLMTPGSHTIGARITDQDGYSTIFSTTVLVNAAADPKLTGTVIGTTGSYKNDGNTAAKAFDGNLTTFFDGPSASGNWVGLDLGSAKVISSLAYASRSGWASRMNGGIFQASNSSTFASGVVNLYTIASNASPSSTSLTTQTISNATAYRYVRYYSPANSYGDVAEVQFFGHSPVMVSDGISGTVSGAPAGTTVYLDANNNSKLDSTELSTTTGANGAYSFSNVPAGSYIIREVLPSGYTQTTPAANGGYAIAVTNGTSITNENFTDVAPVLSRFAGSNIRTSGSYQNDGNTIAKATDNNLSTFFDGPSANGDWVGLDLGTAKVVKQIQFAPRSGWASRMVGGIFQASTSANFGSGVTNIYTITTAPPQGVLTSVSISLNAAYRYYRYLSPNGSYGDISEFQLFG